MRRHVGCQRRSLVLPEHQTSGIPWVERKTSANRGTSCALGGLAADAKEKTNVAAYHSDVAERLKKMCLDWRRSLP